MSAVEMAENVDVVPSKPRTVGRQRHRVNTPAPSPYLHCRRNIYHLIQELEDMLTGKFSTNKMIF